MGNTVEPSNAKLPTTQLAQRRIVYTLMPRYPDVEIFIVSDRPDIQYVNKSCAGQGLVMIIPPSRARRTEQNFYAAQSRNSPEGTIIRFPLGGVAT